MGFEGSILRAGEVTRVASKGLLVVVDPEMLLEVTLGGEYLGAVVLTTVECVA